MQITLNQRDIEFALKMYLAAQGVVVAGRSFSVEFTAGRKPGGLLAEIEIGAAPDFDIQLQGIQDQAPKVDVPVPPPSPSLTVTPELRRAGPVSMASIPPVAVASIATAAPVAEPEVPVASVTPAAPPAEEPAQAEPQAVAVTESAAPAEVAADPAPELPAVDQTDATAAQAIKNMMSDLGEGEVVVDTKATASIFGEPEKKADKPAAVEATAPVTKPVSLFA